MPPGKVVHFISSLECGGAERMLVRLLLASDRARFVHSVICLTDGGSLMEPLRQAGIPVHALGMKRGRLSLGALVRGVMLLRRIKPGLVQTWLYHADLLGLIAARLSGCRTVVWNLRCSDMDLSHYSRLTRLVIIALAYLSRRPAAILSNSQAGLTYHEALGYRPRRSQVIPNGIDTDQFQPDPAARAAWREHWGFGDSTVVFGMAARRDPMKDHEGFLAATEMVAKRCPNCAFVLVGRGVDQDAGLLALAAKVAVPVRMMAEQSAIAEVFAAWDVAVSASRFGEGFPNVIVEAMACGLPVVATDCGDAASIVGNAGIIAARGRPETLATAMIGLYDDVSLRRRLGDAARQRVAENFSLPRCVRAYEDLYATLTGKEC